MNDTPAQESPEVVTKIPHWPCPNNCLNWCRTDGSKTNHHPNCEHVDASLISVWRISDAEGQNYVSDDKPTDEMLADCGLTSSEERMHREIYEQLPEFQGF